MPTPMRRRCYIKIIAPGKASFTTSFKSKVLTFPRGKKHYIDLVDLNIVSSMDSHPFFGVAATDEYDGTFAIDVYNKQEDKTLGFVSTFSGCRREKDFRCVIIDD